jgi:hypothetical protein
MLTVKDVGDACGLPGPVIMQWVPRTWVDGHGWMFTPGQLRAAVEIAEDYRRERTASTSLREHDPTDDAVVCDGCGAVVSAGDATRAGWLHAVEPDCGVHADPTGRRDYCPACLVSCPTCRGTDEVCEDCFGAKRIPKSIDYRWDRR